MYLYQKSKKASNIEFMDVDKCDLSHFNFLADKTLDKIKILKNAIYRRCYFAYLSTLLRNLYKYTLKKNKLLKTYLWGLFFLKFFEGFFRTISDH